MQFCFTQHQHTAIISASTAKTHQWLRVFGTLLLVMVLNTYAMAEPNQLGQTGLINMPDARIEPEGTFRLGLSRMEPYKAIWSSISAYDWLEMSARYTEISHVDAFVNRPDDHIGDYKDKAFDAKLRLLKEGTWWPQITVGNEDYFGTRVFAAKFIVLSKRFGDLDITLGHGIDRIDGNFGGIRYSPAFLGRWSLVAEYDAIDYQHEFKADVSGAITRKGGTSVGLNYRWGWLGAQLSYQREDTYGLLGYVSIPFQEKEFIPKLDEPSPYTQRGERPNLAAWQQDPQYSAALIRALETQQYQNVKVWLNGTTLEVGVATPRISLMGRAVGRATRTALLMSPLGTQTISVTYYTLKDLPVLTYQFNDLDQLDQFFSGQLNYGDLIKSMKVEYASPDAAQLLEQHKVTIPESLQAADDQGLKVERNEDGHLLRLRHADSELNGYLINPFHLGIFFNDPSGAFKYDWFMTANAQRFLGSGWFINGGLRMSVLEDVSDVKQASNSLLPHVRTDVALYKEQRGVKLNNLLINKYLQLQPRWYARLSAGVYEEMFGGAGGQILYQPKDQNWAADLAVDRVKQRDYEGGFDFLDYQTTTTILSLHYRIKSQGLLFTLRGGKFLAKDEGARLEVSRRFRSGVKIGAWYTHTNANDITGPGSPGDPYQDKGVFLQIPLNSMLTKDTRAKANMSIRPWTRDGGQLVHSPGDLYELFDNPLMLDQPEYNLLSRFHE